MIYSSGAIKQSKKKVHKVRCSPRLAVFSISLGIPNKFQVFNAFAFNDIGLST